MQFYCSDTNHYRAHTGAANLVQRIRPKLWQRGYGFDGPRAPDSAPYAAQIAPLACRLPSRRRSRPVR